MSDWNSTKSLMRISDTTLTGASNITSGVQVKWSQVTGATGYIVYRKGAGKGWGRIADIKERINRKLYRYDSSKRNDIYIYSQSIQWKHDGRLAQREVSYENFGYHINRSIQHNLRSAG